jgi:hypothetical protein
MYVHVSVYVCVWCVHVCVVCVCVCVWDRERERQRKTESEGVSEYVDEWVSEWDVTLCCCLFEMQKNVQIATVNIIYIKTHYLNFVCQLLLVMLLIIFISAAVERRWKCSNPVKCVEELYT